MTCSNEILSLSARRRKKFTLNQERNVGAQYDDRDRYDRLPFVPNRDPGVIYERLLQGDTVMSMKGRQGRTCGARSRKYHQQRPCTQNSNERRIRQHKTPVPSRQGRIPHECENGHGLGSIMVCQHKRAGRSAARRTSQL
jgi:hypothetical protein